MDPSTLRVAGGEESLAPSAQIPVVVDAEVEADLQVLGLAVPVDVARRLAGVVLALSVAALAVGGRIGRPRRGDAADEFLVRHAARIMPVAGFTPGRTVVDVSDAEALTRVAARIDGLLLHHAGPDGQTLAVQDAETTYRYTFPAELVEPRPARPRVPLRAVPAPPEVLLPDVTRPLARIA